MTQSAQTPFAVPQTTVPIAGGDLRFPVRRIYCIGRNYAAHAIEMGSTPAAKRRSFSRSRRTRSRWCFRTRWPITPTRR